MLHYPALVYKYKCKHIIILYVSCENNTWHLNTDSKVSCGESTVLSLYLGHTGSEIRVSNTTTQGPEDDFVSDWLSETKSDYPAFSFVSGAMPRIQVCLLPTHNTRILLAQEKYKLLCGAQLLKSLCSLWQTQGLDCRVYSEAANWCFKWDWWLPLGWGLKPACTLYPPVGQQHWGQEGHHESQIPVWFVNCRDIDLPVWSEERNPQAASRKKGVCWGSVITQQIALEKKVKDHSYCD